MLIKRKRSYGYFLFYKLSDIYGSKQTGLNNNWSKQTENCKMKNPSKKIYPILLRRSKGIIKKLLTKVRNIVIAYFPKV